jgi:hypothetical protein
MVLLPTGERIEDWESIKDNSTMKTCSHKPTAHRIHEDGPQSSQGGNQSHGHCQKNEYLKDVTS